MGIFTVSFLRKAESLFNKGMYNTPVSKDHTCVHILDTRTNRNETFHFHRPTLHGIFTDAIVVIMETNKIRLEVSADSSIDMSANLTHAIIVDRKTRIVLSGENAVRKARYTGHPTLPVIIVDMWSLPHIKCNLIGSIAVNM